MGVICHVKSQVLFSFVFWGEAGGCFPSQDLKIGYNSVQLLIFILMVQHRDSLMHITVMEALQM